MRATVLLFATACHAGAAGPPSALGSAFTPVEIQLTFEAGALQPAGGRTVVLGMPWRVEVELPPEGVARSVPPFGAVGQPVGMDADVARSLWLVCRTDPDADEVELTMAYPMGRASKQADDRPQAPPPRGDLRVGCAGTVPPLGFRVAVR